MNINKLIGILIIFWCITLGLIFVLHHESPEKVAGTVDEENNSLEIAFLDIGQGDATFITFPDGTQMLIDCAEDSRVLEALGRVMPFYDRSIDYVLITHPDQDHYGGCIDVFDRFDVEKIMYTGYQKPESIFFQAFTDAVAANTAEYIEVTEPVYWDIASTTVDILYPASDVQTDIDLPTGSNNSSLVVRIDYFDTEVLLTGDAEKELENYLLDRYADELDIDILKAGHHGSSSSSILPFITATSPSQVIFSAGMNNRYGHPSPRVVKRFERVSSSTIWRTDTDGDILIHITDTEVTINNQDFSVDRSNN